MTTIENQIETGRVETDDAIRIREAVAVFPSERLFLDAVDDLLEHGFDRADLSVLARSKHAGRGFASLFGDTVALADDASVPRDALTGPASIAEAEAASVALPVYACTIGGFLIAAATGGTLAFAIPVAVAGGLAGGGLGLLGAAAISNRHRETIDRQISTGGILLWVRTESVDREKQAMRILDAAGGEHVHLHTTSIRWGEDNIPLAHINPDPLLERGPQYD